MGFEFKTELRRCSGVSGLSYAVLAQKLQADLARGGDQGPVGSDWDQVNLRTQYTTGKSDCRS